MIMTLFLLFLLDSFLFYSSFYSSFPCPFFLSTKTHSPLLSYLGPLCRPLEVMFGTRRLVTASGFIVGASVVLASLSTGVTQLTLTLALTAGKL